MQQVYEVVLKCYIVINGERADLRNLAVDGFKKKLLEGGQFPIYVEGVGINDNSRGYEVVDLPEQGGK